MENSRYIEITNLLKEFCVPKNLLGYEYIISAVEILYDNPKILIFDLYEEIAKLHDSKAANCERSIRHAIECGYNNCIECGLDTFKRVCFSNKKPCNSEFLKSVYMELKILEGSDN